ncbi:MAG: S-adenosylmethionine transporter [Vezdaea aestivalis]|nr:MAG: S-adenosylmethionine transporter [Vezdaea aestivalis]
MTTPFSSTKPASTTSHPANAPPPPQKPQKDGAPLISSPFARALLAGGAAGTLVDISLFPLDTIKTRLQSAQGFFPAGGFRGIYSGLGSVASASAPSGALFFVVYTTLKARFAETGLGEGAVSQVLAASAGEVASCAIRIPVEVVKQRTQAGQRRAGREIWTREKGLGLVRAFYKGAGITVLREVPFTAMQFPIWEALKKRVGSEGTFESAACGSVAGAAAACLTTPLDVVKTRVMLERRKVGIGEVARGVWDEAGWRGFFKGVAPRMMWISIGGAVFLGGYQGVANALA